MRFDAVPTVGVNEVKFGMNREEVRSLLGEETEFYKFDDDTNGDFEQDDDGLISFSKSIGIYASNGDMESVLSAKKGYYNNEV